MACCRTGAAIDDARGRGTALHSSAAPFGHLVAALLQGLNDEGFVEGRSVTIEQRWADNRLDRLPDLAADLVRRQAAVIVGNVGGVQAARNATATIPIIFVTGEDPIKSGLVNSISRPAGNLTGVTFFGGASTQHQAARTAPRPPPQCEDRRRPG